MVYTPNRQINATQASQIELTNYNLIQLINTKAKSLTDTQKLAKVNQLMAVKLNEYVASGQLLINHVIQYESLFLKKLQIAIIDGGYYLNTFPCNWNNFTIKDINFDDEGEWEENNDILIQEILINIALYRFQYILDNYQTLSPEWIYSYLTSLPINYEEVLGIKLLRDENGEFYHEPFCDTHKITLNTTHGWMAACLWGYHNLYIPIEQLPNVQWENFTYVQSDNDLLVQQHNLNMIGEFFNLDELLHKLGFSHNQIQFLYTVIEEDQLWF